MRRTIIAAAVVGVACTAFAIPRPVAAQTVSVNGPCVGAPLLGNSMTLTGGVASTQGGPGVLTKTANLACVVAGVSGLVVSEGLASQVGTGSNTGLSGNCLLSAGPYRIKTIGEEIVIGDAVVLGVGDAILEVDALVPHTPRDLPCSGSPANPTLTYDMLDVQNDLPPQVP